MEHDMIAHQIENNVIINTIKVDSLDVLPNLINAENGGSIGDRYENGNIIVTPLVLPEPQVSTNLKLTGIEIFGVMCSATSGDQNGLAAVAIGITLARMNKQVFPDTQFKFENGNALVITDQNFDEIYAKWTPFRQSFFNS
jgi:hypothetical protein